jgi:AGCS family alanine or glycine:cation symporter
MELFMEDQCIILTKGLKERNMTVLGKVLAGLFAVFVIGGSFGGGNAFQSNQATVQLSSLLGLKVVLQDLLLVL